LKSHMLKGAVPLVPYNNTADIAGIRSYQVKSYLLTLDFLFRAYPQNHDDILLILKKIPVLYPHQITDTLTDQIARTGNHDIVLHYLSKIEKAFSAPQFKGDHFDYFAFYESLISIYHLFSDHKAIDINTFVIGIKISNLLPRAFPTDKDPATHLYRLITHLEMVSSIQADMLSQETGSSNDFIQKYDELTREISEFINATTAQTRYLLTDPKSVLKFSRIQNEKTLLELYLNKLNDIIESDDELAQVYFNFLLVYLDPEVGMALDSYTANTINAIWRKANERKITEKVFFSPHAFTLFSGEVTHAPLFLAHIRRASFVTQDNFPYLACFCYYLLHITDFSQSNFNNDDALILALQNKPAPPSVTLNETQPNIQALFTLTKTYLLATKSVFEKSNQHNKPITNANYTSHPRVMLPILADLLGFVDACVNANQSLPEKSLDSLAFSSNTRDFISEFKGNVEKFDTGNCGYLLYSLPAATKIEQKAKFTTAHLLQKLKPMSLAIILVSYIVDSQYTLNDILTLVALSKKFELANALKRCLHSKAISIFLRRKQVHLPINKKYSLAMNLLNSHDLSPDERMVLPDDKPSNDNQPTTLPDTPPAPLPNLKRLKKQAHKNRNKGASQNTKPLILTTTQHPIYPQLEASSKPKQVRSKAASNQDHRTLTPSSVVTSAAAKQTRPSQSRSLKSESRQQNLKRIYL